MTQCLIEKTVLPEVLVIQPRRFEDERGYFCESWSRRDLAAAGIVVDFVQDNHSLSRVPGTVRGLHFQAPPRAQDKLVRCTRGAIHDAAVDIRVGSPTYGQSVVVELSAENGRQLFVPKGFLHGFVTLLPDTEVQYKCSDYYAPDCDGAVKWDSAGVAWGIDAQPILSAKDSIAQSLSRLRSPFSYGAVEK